jgi:putative tricarboxylic transport membrane protein
MRTADIVCALVLGGIGIVMIAESIRLGNGWEAEGPQAGFFPFLLGTVIVLGCAVILWRALHGKGAAASAKPFIKPGALRSVLWVVIPAALMILFTEVIGLYAAAAVYLLGYIRIVGGHRWHTALSISLLVPLVFYVIFDRIFLIPMPAGMLERFLPF